MSSVINSAIMGIPLSGTFSNGNAHFQNLIFSFIGADSMVAKPVNGRPLIKQFESSYTGNYDIIHIVCETNFEQSVRAIMGMTKSVLLNPFQLNHPFNSKTVSAIVGALSTDIPIHQLVVGYYELVLLLWAKYDCYGHDYTLGHNTINGSKNVMLDRVHTDLTRVSSVSVLPFKTILENNCVPLIEILNNLGYKLSDDQLELIKSNYDNYYASQNKLLITDPRAYLRSLVPAATEQMKSFGVEIDLDFFEPQIKV